MTHALSLETPLFCALHQVEHNTLPWLEQARHPAAEDMLDAAWDRAVGKHPADGPAAWKAGPADQRADSAVGGSAVLGR